jgi:hypothetical protein
MVDQESERFVNCGLIMMNGCYVIAVIWNFSDIVEM